MKGLDEFIKLFGDITVLQIVEVVLAGVFLYFVYGQVKKFFKKQIEEQNARRDTEKKRDEQLKEALDAVHRYPEYRKQSIEIQQSLEAQITSLTEMYKEMAERLVQMEEETRRRERNKIRDLLLQNYRYYVNAETNPSHSWTKVEAETFWELFREYEDAGGNGHMHTDVMPAMELLTITEDGER